MTACDVCGDWSQIELPQCNECGEKYCEDCASEEINLCKDCKDNED